MPTIDSDILGQMKTDALSQEDLLRQINLNLEHIARSMSLAEVENARTTRSERARIAEDDARSDSSNDKWKVNRKRGGKGDFADAMLDQLEKSLFGESLQDMLGKSLGSFAESLGVQMDDLGNTMGQLAGNTIANAIKSSPIGDEFSKKVKGFKEQFAGNIQTVLDDVSGKLNGKKASEAAKGMSDIANAAQSSGQAMGGMNTALATNISKMTGLSEASGAAIAQLGTMAAQALAAGAVVGIALLAIDAFTEMLQESWEEVKEAGKELAQAMDDAANRAEKMMGVKLEERMKRQEADFKAVIESSYDVMQDAANKMLDAWDSSLRTITATQGYTKAGVQDLLSSYAQRLRDEGLSSVVSTADITTNLEQVLKSGLSGQVAEEFAYLATILNAAIPTEDFFGYAETYASVAANAIAAGKSQQEAIEYANAELEQFANNLLYSSRELAGGFSTGLKNASGLFESANKIAVASRRGNAGEISGVLTAVSAAIGAVAPDLASGLVDNVVQAALGGNNESVTALRSLSGVGASNTAFLQALATDAQGVFASLFSNLANLQSMSKDNYMEVAEGLSQIFGISMDAFARVDFSYLSSVISSMNLDGDALGQNLSLLISGQTTYTAEQARIAEVNKVMIEEGLAYVLDNEVARSIQENMWAEQRAQEIKENEFAVNLQGSALKLLNSLENLANNILSFLNPLSYLKDATQFLGTIAENNYKEVEIEALLEKTVVGIGNNAALYNLTHRGTDLNLVTSYLDRLGGAEGMAAVKLGGAGALVNAAHTATGLLTAAEVLSGNFHSPEFRDALGQARTYLGQTDLIGNMLKGGAGGLLFGNLGGTKNAVASSYTWGTVGKSSLALSGYRGAGNSGSFYTPLTAITSATDSMLAASREKINELFGTMQKYVDENRTFEEWSRTASQYGIMDLEQALSDFDMTLEDAKGQFTNLETAAGVQKQHELAEKEEAFWDASILWYETTWPEDLADTQDLMLEMHEALMDQLARSHKQLVEFYDQWIDYYVNHTAYSKETLDAYSVASIRTAERAEVGDSVLALAEALTTTSIDLKDPAVQTNALLAKILIVTEAIMQQTNDTTTVSLPTALASLGLGTVTEGPRG